MKPEIDGSEFGLITIDDDLAPTPEAIVRWNKAHGAVLGLFHVTC